MSPPCGDGNWLLKSLILWGDPVSDDTRIIAAWIRKTDALAERLGVPPADVYETLTDLGYTGERKRFTMSTKDTVAFISSLFRPAEILSIPELTIRFTSRDGVKATPPVLERYITAILSRNEGEKGCRRFRRVRKGAYRLQLSNAELRVSALEEMANQRAFVSSKRFMELFDISYDRLFEVLKPLSQQGRVISRPNSTTGSRDWCLQKYAGLFSK